LERCQVALNRPKLRSFLTCARATHADQEKQEIGGRTLPGFAALAPSPMRD